ncbi:MAG TPA: hypothetical protein VFO60_00740, partial [Candidatus Dormibacteraeota bacterium]|nr:hypothetical protein [Candidatus Dormibacteraeota bacterium]
MSTPPSAPPPARRALRLRLLVPAVAAGAMCVATACSSATPTATVPSTTRPDAPSAAAQTSSAQPPPVQSGAACSATGEQVTTAAELTKALADATPGTTMVLAPGTYTGQFTTRVSGTQQAPITMCGPAGAVLDGGTTKSGYTLHLDGASWWRLVGFGVTDGQKGVVVDHGHNVDISGLS